MIGDVGGSGVVHPPPRYFQVLLRRQRQWLQLRGTGRSQVAPAKHLGSELYFVFAELIPRRCSIRSKSLSPCLLRGAVDAARWLSCYI